MADLTMETLLALARKCAGMNPQLLWGTDREAARREDVEYRRGHLILNPEVPEFAEWEGMIVEREGKEYRAIIDKHLVGSRDGDGKVVGGYWLDPPPEFFPLVPRPK